MDLNQNFFSFHFTTTVHHDDSCYSKVHFLSLWFASFTLHWKNDRRFFFCFFQKISHSTLSSWYIKKNCIYVQILFWNIRRSRQNIRRHFSRHFQLDHIYLRGEDSYIELKWKISATLLLSEINFKIFLFTFCFLLFILSIFSQCFEKSKALKNFALRYIIWFFSIFDSPNIFCCNDFYKTFLKCCKNTLFVH